MFIILFSFTFPQLSPPQRVKKRKKAKKKIRFSWTKNRKFWTSESKNQQPSLYNVAIRNTKTKQSTFLYKENARKRKENALMSKKFKATWSTRFKILFSSTFSATNQTGIEAEKGKQYLGIRVFLSFRSERSSENEQIKQARSRLKEPTAEISLQQKKCFQKTKTAVLVFLISHARPSNREAYVKVSGADGCDWRM